MTFAATLRQMGGRVSGRGLTRTIMIILCVSGLGLVGKGALIPAKAVVAQVLLERAFAQSLQLHRPVKPWGWADTAPVARITVPRLGVQEIVLGEGSGQAMAFGPTALPAGAAPAGEGTSIMAAHRDTHFAFLKDLRVGDQITVEAISGKVRHYRIRGFEVVRWDSFAFSSHPRRPTLALTSCYPLDAVAHGPLRYVVWAEAGESGK